jgi:hypothetical protein
MYTAPDTVRISESQDSPLSSGFKIRKDLSSVEGDIPFTRRFPPMETKNVAQPTGDEVGSKIFEPIL